MIPNVPFQARSVGRGTRTFDDIPNSKVQLLLLYCGISLRTTAVAFVAQMRSVIAARMVKSKHEVPHHYATIKCHLDEVLTIRKMLAGMLFNFLAFVDIQGFDLLMLLQINTARRFP